MSFDSTVVSALIGGLAGLLVVLVSKMWERVISEKQSREKVHKEYLNPLRLYLVETYFRLSEIIRRTRENNNHCDDLAYIDQPDDPSSKDDEWFNGQGCYLVSSCYLTACLFYLMKKVWEDIPYLRLHKNDDTTLLTLLMKVSLGFRRNLGIFYLT